MHALCSVIIWSDHEKTQMRHSNIDRYAGNSAFYELDPRGKIIGLIFFIVVVALLQTSVLLMISLIYVVSLLAIANVPFSHLVRRYLLSLPFIVFAAFGMYVSKDMSSSMSIFLRVSTCVLALLLLSTTTAFFDLLKALQRLKCPRLFVALLMFTYRYFFTLTGELHRMTIARRARGFLGGRHLLDRRAMRVFAFTAGMLLVRAYERGNRIYNALLARGYDGTFKTMKQLQFKSQDYVFCITLSTMSVLLICIEWDLAVMIWTS